MAPIRSSLAIAAFLTALTTAAPPAQAGESLQLVEQEIKAGLLYNFLKYTNWPDSAEANAPMVVCLFGGDPFSGRLQTMSGRTVNQRVIEIRNVAAIGDAGACSLLFIHSGLKPQWAQLQAALAGKPLLTVSDFAGFSDAGGMIEFTRVDNRVGVKINTTALAATNLRVEDRLLKLASNGRR